MLWNLSEGTSKSSLTQPLPKREGHPHHPARSLVFNHESWITSTGSHQKVREVVGDLSQEMLTHPWQRRSTVWLLCTWMQPLRVTPSLSLWLAFNSPHPHGQPLLPFDHPSVWAAVSSFPSRLWQREPGVFLLRGEQGVEDLEIRPFFISVATGSTPRDHKLIYLQKGHLFKWLTAEVVRPYCLDFS